MTEKELSEIKRRLRPDKNSIEKICGCYVSGKDILSEFEISIGSLNEFEEEALFKTLKKVLSGSFGKNLLDIAFSTEQVENSEEHKLLMKLRETELCEKEFLQKLYSKILGSYITENDYLVLVAYDKYDIPSFSKNDEFADESIDIFRYILCAVCPVKLTKQNLGFSAPQKSFSLVGAENVVSAPEIGFMFPAFDDRTANIYNALFYTKSASEDYSELVDMLFKTEIMMPADEQKETFRNIVAETAQSSCNYEFVQSVHDAITEIIDDHKSRKDPEQLLIGKNDVKRVLASCGATEEELETFDEKFNQGFGEKTEISPQNIIDPKQFEVKTNHVVVKIEPEYSHMVDTKIIDGVKYIMVRADEVEVNGIKINFDNPLKN